MDEKKIIDGIEYTEEQARQIMSRNHFEKLLKLYAKDVFTNWKGSNQDVKIDDYYDEDDIINELIVNILDNLDQTIRTELNGMVSEVEIKQSKSKVVRVMTEGNAEDFVEDLYDRGVVELYDDLDDDDITFEEI